ncbi:MAG: hypothetical protein FD189_1938 [Elusimicrobia bacterium]|nr:MAG: hypothetical protein FD154_1604 [Elusimicrobiota bacterium]KAF0154342.1 MAG: hypothetical protein FD189_1938 [Elusimicrobiota bacterium]
MKGNENRGFAYFISGGMLAAYKEKPAVLRLGWLYAGNVLRRAYPEKLKRLQDMGRMRRGEAGGGKEKSMAGHILKLKKHNADREIEFELKYLASLTTRQRFEMMFRKTREIFGLLRKNGRRTTAEVIKRA